MLTLRRNEVSLPNPVYETAPRPPISSPLETSPSNRSTIGADLNVVGNLVSTGELLIEGVVQGDIQGVNILIRETAQITGTITGHDVIVHGEVKGTLKAERVVLAGTCRLEGDVFHQSLSIEQGAFFEGKSRRGSPQGEAKGANRLPPFEDNP